MERTNYENLQTYQLSERLADEIWNIVARWEAFSRNTVGSQIVRSVDSIGANIAEGNGKGTTEDYRRYLRHARGSLYETKHWLRRAENRQLLSETDAALIHEIMQELIPKLNAYMRSLNQRVQQERSTLSKNQRPKT